MGNLQIPSWYNIVLPKIWERGILKTPITLTNLLSHNLQLMLVLKQNSYKQERETETDLLLIVKGKNSKSYSAFSWLTPILLSFY